MLKCIDRFLDVYYDERKIDKESIFFPEIGSPEYPDKDSFYIQLYQNKKPSPERIARAVISFAEGCYIRYDDARPNMFTSMNHERYTELKYLLQERKRKHGNYPAETLVEFEPDGSMILLGFDNSRSSADPLFGILQDVGMKFAMAVLPQRPYNLPEFFRDLPEREMRHFDFRLYDPIRVENRFRRTPESNCGKILANDMWIYIYPEPKRSRMGKAFLAKPPIKGIITLRNSGPFFISYNIMPDLCRHSEYRETELIETTARFTKILSNHWIQRREQTIEVAVEPLYEWLPPGPQVLRVKIVDDSICPKPTTVITCQYTPSENPS